MSLKSELISEAIQQNFIQGTFIALVLFIIASTVSFLILRYTKKLKLQYRLFPIIMSGIMTIALLGTVIMGTTYTLQPINIIEGTIIKTEIITRKDYIRSNFKKYPGQYAYINTASGEQKFHIGVQTVENFKPYLGQKMQYVIRKEELIGIVDESKIIMNHKTIDINQ